MQATVVIPVLNEAPNLLRLTELLLAQQNVELEILFVDGGSSDQSQALLEGITEANDNVRWCSSSPGRGIQLNTGAGQATHETLVLLHADSHIEDNALLSQGLMHSDANCQRAGTRHLAGHFGMRFLREAPTAGKGWFFFEAKTHLNRLDCINGDQGWILDKTYLEQLGYFDTQLGYLEDLRLARQIHAEHAWMTLPGLVYTSARRFEAEGLRARGILNAFIKCFDDIGFHEYFDAAADAYREQQDSDRLHLRPFCRLAFNLSLGSGAGYGIKRWYQTGRYINRNAWQLAFLLDCRRCEGTPADVELTWTGRYDRYIAWLITSPPAGLITGLLTMVWVASMLVTED